MILPEDPEKEALQRRLDEQMRDPELAIRIRRRAQLDQMQNPEADTLPLPLVLPPPPYNPLQLERSMSRTHGTDTGLMPSSRFMYSQNPQASSSSVQLDRTRRETFEVDDSDVTFNGPLITQRTTSNDSSSFGPHRQPTRTDESAHTQTSTTSTNWFVFGSNSSTHKLRKGKGRAWNPDRLYSSRRPSDRKLIPLWAGQKWTRKKWLIAALFLVLLISGIVGGLVGGLSLGERSKRRHSSPSPVAGSRMVVPWDSHGFIAFNPLASGPPVEDGTPTNCNIWSPLADNNILRGVAFAPYGQTVTYATYYLNKNASSLFVHAKGDSTTGSIQMLGIEDIALLSAGEIPSDQIRVDVIKRSGVNATESLVCELNDSTGRQGVGVYTQALSIDNPQVSVAGDPNLSFFILVRFPPSPDLPMTRKNTVNTTATVDSPQDRLPKLVFETDQMGVKIGNMKGLVSFGEFDATLGRGLIGVEYIAAKNISLQTYTSTIWGTFNVSETLTLNTTSGGLLADVILHNPTYNPDYVVTTTHTSLSKRAKYLQPSSPHHQVFTDMDPVVIAPDFDPTTAPIQPITVRGQTTNGPLLIEYLSHPPGVVLDSAVYTSNGEASTRMHPAFQGSFLLRSVNGDLRIPESNDVEPNSNGLLNFTDPWDQGRKRVITYDQGNNTAFGQNLTSSGDDSISPWGFTRGDSTYNQALGSFQVAGVTMWLSPEEIAEAVNITAIAIQAATDCLSSGCTGYEAMRNSKSITQTSWGGGELCFS